MEAKRLPLGVKCDSPHAPGAVCLFGDWGWRGVMQCKYCKQAPPGIAKEPSMPPEKIDLPPIVPTVWVEVDEDQTGRPYWKAGHLSPDAIKGEHRRVACVSLAQAEAYAAVAVEQDRRQSRCTVSPGEMRYEFVRKMKPAEFAELFRRNICGEGSFDALVDEAIAAAAAAREKEQAK